MKNDNIIEMLESNDKDCVYLAVSMIRNYSTLLSVETKKSLNKISLFDKIKNYSDVCKDLGEDELKLSDFNFLSKDYRKKAFNQAKLQQIQKLFNGDWKLDWSDTTQYKWFPYFEIKVSGGIGFYVTYFHSSHFGDAPAYFKYEETSNFVGKLFIDIYKELM